MSPIEIFRQVVRDVVPRTVRIDLKFHPEILGKPLNPMFYSKPYYHTHRTKQGP